MTLSIPIAHHSTPAGPLTAAPNRNQGSLASPAMPGKISCRLQIDRAVSQIESPEVREVIDAVFQDLLGLLECLNLIEGHLRSVDSAQETFALFQIINEEARAMVEFIREDGLQCEAIPGDLADTFDEIIFVVNHDLLRVFENEQHGATSEKTSQVVVGKLYRAHDVLTNCLQQSTITLAMMFDSELIGARLFNNSDVRYRQSVQLCEDLSTLIQLVSPSEDQGAFLSLTAGIEKFRNDSMECLMYSDWPQFESFCERIEIARTSLQTLEPVLHQFRCYLETLLSQVKMRAVLSNLLPIPFGAIDNRLFSTAPGDNAAPSWYSFDLLNEFQGKKTPWSPLALAG